MLEHPDITRANRYGYHDRTYYMNEAMDDARAAQEEALDWLRTEVSYWTENELDEGREPSWARFVDAHPKYDREELIDVIEREMSRTVKLCDPDGQMELEWEYKKWLEAIA